MVNYGYYIKLSTEFYESVRFLGIEAKTEGLGKNQIQKQDKDGNPYWIISALVKYQGGKQEAETFTIVVPIEHATKISTIPELTQIKLFGLSGGKWTKANSDKTAWTFQIENIEVIKPNG